MLSGSFLDTSFADADAPADDEEFASSAFGCENVTGEVEINLETIDDEDEDGLDGEDEKNLEAADEGGFDSGEVGE